MYSGCSLALENTQALTLPLRCEEDTNAFLWEINQKRPKEYAVLMYDAFGKLGSNVEGGNVNQPGSVEQCRSAHGPTFSGQYCQVFLRQEKVQYFVGICVPDSCGEEDVQMLVLYGRLQFGQTSLIPPLPSIFVNQSTQEMIMTHCLPNTIAPDASDVTCLFVCCVMVAIPLAATLFMAIMRRQRNREVSPCVESSCLNTGLNLYGTLKTNGSSSREMNRSTSEENGKNNVHYDTSRTPQCFPRSCVNQCLQAFSLQNTSQGVLSSSSSIPGGGYSSVNGIRVLSLLWIVCGHSAEFSVINNLDNYKNWKKTVESSPVYVFAFSGPVFLAVDTFLLLGGLLSARSLLSSIRRSEDKLSACLVADYLFKRIKRIQPLHLFIMCLTTGLVSLVQWGPYWFPLMETLMDCKTYWWANVLLISNLLPVHEICIPWTWYLSLDFQCYATTPLLLYFYRLNRNVFAAVAGGLLLMTTVAGAVITALLQLPVFEPSTMTSYNYVLHYYVKPYTRYGPFLIGILTGIYLMTKKDQLLKQKWQAALGWLFCLSLMAVLVGLAYVLRETPAYPSVPHALYQGLHRPLWALAVTWIILACEEGYGGYIKSFLSLGFWVPLSNISFACYLSHPVFIILYIGLQETPIHYTDLNFMYLFLGHVGVTLVVSYLLTVLVEKPYLLLKCSRTSMQEKGTVSDCLKLPSSSCNMSDCLSLCSEPVPKDNDLGVHAYFGSSEPILPLLPHFAHDLISTPSETFSEFYIKQEPSLSFSLIQDNTEPEASGVMSPRSEGSMELPTTEPLSRLSFSSEHSRATCLLRLLSPHSDRLESDTAIAAVSDLYIFETETQDFILSPNVDPHETEFPECQPLSQTEEKKTHHDCDTHVLISDSADVLTKCDHSSTEERALVDYESDVVQHTELRPHAVGACEVSLVSVNDARRGKTEVTGLTPKTQQSNRPVELWLDACQYLAVDDTEDRDVLDKTRHSVMQVGLSATSDMSCLLPGETQVSGYNPKGGEGIGCLGEDTTSRGPKVQRLSSVDSWASALSDWAGIITRPPEDITAAVTEIGAEIDALTQALAEVNTDPDTATSKVGQIQGTAVQAQSQPPMGVQDQPLEAQNIPESPILSGQNCLSLGLKGAGPELQDRETSFICPVHPHSSMGSSTAASLGGYGVDVTAVTLIPGSTLSADLELSPFGGYVESLETDIVLSNEDSVILKITEDTDLEGENAPELIIGESSGDGLCEVTDEDRISQPSLVTKQEAKRSCGPAHVDGVGTESSADPHFLTTHTLTNSHVPGVDTKPGLQDNVHTHVAPDTLPDLDGACQVEPQWGSPKFIVPLTPLSIGSSLLCATGSSLEGDQICAKRSLNDNRDLSCDHVEHRVLWPTSDGITDKPFLEGDEELIHKKENTLDSANKSSPEAHQKLHSGKTSECSLTRGKTIIEEINDLSRGLSNLVVVPADNFIISKKNRVACITLDLNDPFVSRAAKPIVTAIPSEKAELNQITAEKMPHKTHKSTSEIKTRSKKDKSAGHHLGAQASKKQENLSHYISAQQTSKQQEIHPLSGENQSSENTPTGLEDNQAKLGIETAVAADKAPTKPHGKKKKKHGHNATAPKSVAEPLAKAEYGAKPKTAKGRIDMFEAKLGAKAEKTQRDRNQSDGAEKNSQQLEAKASQGERPARHVEHKDHLPKKFTSPPKDDVIKRRRLSEDKSGKIVNVLESKLPKPDVSIKAKAEEPKADAEATCKKAYSEVVKQKIPLKRDPKVVQPIQAVSVSADPQSLRLWCQFVAVFSDHTVTWSKEGTVLAEIKRSAGDESRVSLTISNASHKDVGKYQCRLIGLHGSVTLDYLLTYEVLSETVIPPSQKTISSAPVEVGGEEEDVRCSRLMFKEDFLSDQYFGDNHPVSIITEKVHFGEGMHRRAFRTKLQAGEMPLLLPGHSGVLKVHNAISYGTKNNSELVQKNFTLAVEECQVQNTAREYIKAYTAAAQSVESFGEVPEIIPIYLVHRPSNDIPYATLEEELIGDFVKYSVKDGKEINLLRRDSEAGQKCCAFQHWVYHNTEGNLLVTDMQGVGMRLTDVGIATCKKGYKGFKGNCATSFIDQFKALHQCNTYCEILGLKSLQPKAKKPTSALKPKLQPSASPRRKPFGPTVKGKS
ncbi:alpha-protein kinase 2 [Xiphias gladius]|uniref:alpha-protein kinase 2 n=1 Tax=Xiphias gladius TaxID=8245 RepID=UPI001A97E4A9|nr:alpha-protein kinase 2 [Xiphias gladius]